MYAQECARKITLYEPQLDDPAFVASLFKQASKEVPKKPRFRWGFNHLDVGVEEKSTGQSFLFSNHADDGTTALGGDD
jgi:hypothetical protein